MKTKSLILFLLFIVGTSIFVCLFSNRRPAFQKIITETHKQFTNLKDNLRSTERQELITEPKYLEALGLTTNSNLIGNSPRQNQTISAIVSAVTPRNINYVIGFIKSARHFLPECRIHLYSLGLEPSDLILHALNHLGAILWIDAVYRLTTSNVEFAIQRARKHGVASWGIDQPTSALTHPRMFEYFHTQQENFYFHRMVEPAHVVIFNTARIHSQLMLPWVQCSLIPECIAPIGAQRSGCRFDKKPLYRYSGCHRYDMSAFNVVLGILFQYNTSPYLIEDHVFRLEEELKDGTSENSTSSLVRTENANTV